MLPALRLVAAPCHRLVPKRLADQTYPKRVDATASERRYRRRRLTEAASGLRVSDVSPFLPAVLKAPLEPAAVDIVRVSGKTGMSTIRASRRPRRLSKMRGPVTRRDLGMRVPSSPHTSYPLASVNTGPLSHAHNAIHPGTDRHDTPDLPQEGGFAGDTLVALSR